MTRDRRGFVYALDPVRSVTAWKVDELMLDLAACQASLDVQQRKVDALAGAFAAARTRLLDARRSQVLLDIAAERQAHTYMLHVQQQLFTETATLRGLRKELEAVCAALVEARRFADSLDRDREAEIAEHDLGVARRAAVDADDNWMQRSHWRNRSDQD